jgi:long-subunit acyl-CoA synthetase (AMP-forming)
MSQQKALELLWKPEPGMRFLCYLPWHHSFGGLFERLFALHSGGCLAIDDSGGKEAGRLLENFAEIKPNV